MAAVIVSYFSLAMFLEGLKIFARSAKMQTAIPERNICCNALPNMSIGAAQWVQMDPGSLRR